MHACMYVRIYLSIYVCIYIEPTPMAYTSLQRWSKSTPTSLAPTSLAAAARAWLNFSKVGDLAYLLYKANMERTFQNYCARAPAGPHAQLDDRARREEKWECKELEQVRTDVCVAEGIVCDEWIRVQSQPPAVGAQSVLPVKPFFFVIVLHAVGPVHHVLVFLSLPWSHPRSPNSVAITLCR